MIYSLLVIILSVIATLIIISLIAHGQAILILKADQKSLMKLVDILLAATGDKK